MGLPWEWGATAAEAARAYPADTVLPGPVVLMTRAVPVAASREILWRWLCQISVAPYSYDWIDNRGRRSPRELTPGAEDLTVGQSMTIFDLVGFDAGHQWTGRMRRSGTRLFGAVAVTYAAEPEGDDSRLVCRFAVPGATRSQRLRAGALAWGDLVMMRKQLLTLQGLAQAQARAVGS